MTQIKKITESPSRHTDLENLSTDEIISKINDEDKLVANAVEQALPVIGKIVDSILPNFHEGGRLFYIGAGTSGRLGILDASEIPPTFGLPHDRVIGIIAGGDMAIRQSVEFAEDDTEQCRKDLAVYNFEKKDSLIGIAASGSTPYVLGGLHHARQLGAFTAGITNNPNSPMAKIANLTAELIVGPEFITGSTRMKSGTSQKMALNMISTSLMIKIGRVKGNKMINMQLNNEKLVNRGIHFLMDELHVDHNKASSLLSKYGSVKKALYEGSKLESS